MNISQPIFFNFKSVIYTQFLLLLILTFSSFSTIAQDSKQTISNGVPKHLPIEIKIKNNNSENVLKDAEIEITNIGKKPIYYLYLMISTLDVKAPDGNLIGFPLMFGRSDLILFDSLANEDDESILPSESYTFKVSPSKIRNYENNETLWSTNTKPKNFKLLFQLLNFGDGSGFSDTSGSSTNVDDSNEKSNSSSSLSDYSILLPKYQPFSSKSPICSNAKIKDSSFFFDIDSILNISNLCPFGCEGNPSCRPMYLGLPTGCCIAPDDLQVAPQIVFGNCSYTLPFKCREVLTLNVPCDQGGFCSYYTLVPCGSTTCTVATEICNNGLDEDCDDDIDCNDDDCGSSPDCIDECDIDRDGYISTSCGGNDCVDDPSQNPNAASINPGAIELCTGNVDEDCDGRIDCADGNCGQSSQCPECDKDNDNYISPDCEGNDCVDDPAQNPNAANINPGNAEICDDLGNVDENCSGSANCSDSSCTGHSACDTSGGNWECNPYCVGTFLTNASNNAINSCCVYTPIVVDIDGDGFDLTSASNGVMFDFNGDGVPHRISWTKRNSDEAWLVLDRNHNDLIDDATELFGNLTPQPQSDERNGFLALAEYDKTENGGNEDGKINKLDSIFTDLRLWQDKNHNGISEQNELKKLRRLDVKAFKLDYKTTSRVDRHGNEFRYKAKVKDTRDGNVGKWAWDVFLILDQSN